MRDNLLLGRHRLTRSGFVSAGLRPAERRAESAPRRSACVDGSPRCSTSTRSSTRPVGVLPYGDRKRVELGRALCAEPALLLLDEPVAGMNADETARDGAHDRATSREALGISIVLVEHDMPFVMGLADRVTVLDFGRCIADGTPERGPARPGGAARLPRRPSPDADTGAQP